MKSGLYLTYSELFDEMPTTEGLTELIKSLPRRHAIYVLSRINLVLRRAMEHKGNADMATEQQRLLAGHLDDEIIARAKQRIPNAKCDDRPVFLPFGVLNILSLVLVHSDPDRTPDESEDEQVRYAVGRACLMMNDLLINQDELHALRKGSADEQRIELMVQTMSSFELNNPAKDHHLVPRLQVMYRTLLQDPMIKQKIASRCQGFDFGAEFLDLFGITLDRWFFVIYALYAYFVNGLVTDDPNFMVLNSLTFRGESGIGEVELATVLRLISATPAELRTMITVDLGTDSRYDFTSLRAKPLIRIDQNRYLPVDLALLIEKCHTGVQWALHDSLNSKKRDLLFTAWGVLFEEYGHWLLGGMQTKTLIKYSPNPMWKHIDEESFDGLLRRGNTFMPAEYKGGFISRIARSSGKSADFLKDLEKKFVPGCKQLADKIGAIFLADANTRKALRDFGSDHVRTVVPTLILQDHITRTPFLNWYLNKRFREYLAQWNMRSGVSVEALTLINIHDLESIVASAEGANFQFISALNSRTARDPEALSDLMDFLRSYPNFGRSRSPRLDQIIEEIHGAFADGIFPGMNSSKTPTQPN
jgi:hypothetical protein